MKNKTNKITLATDIIESEKNKKNFYKSVSVALSIINIILFIILFTKKG